MANALYTTTAICKGGRSGGKVALVDGRLWFHNEHSKPLGGSGEGTNPEQMLAMGWATCFNGAVLFIAGQKKIDASKAVVKCEVGIGRDESGFGLSAKLTLAVPGLDRAQVQELLETAHQFCPFSKASRGDIPVELAVEG